MTKSEPKKVRSKLTLRLARTGSLVMIVPLIYVFLGSTTGFGLYAIAQSDSTMNVDDTYLHRSLMLGIWCAPALILLPLAIVLYFKASRMLTEQYNTIVQGTVIKLDPSEFRGYAVVEGVNNQRKPLTQRLDVPIKVWSRPLQVGDPYPW